MMTCYLRDTNKFFRYRTLCTNILKCKFPTKGIELTRLEFFEGPRVLSFEALGLDHFGRFGTKICGKQVRLWSKKFCCGWLRWWNFAINIVLSVGRSLFLFVHGQAWKILDLNDIRTTISSENIQLLQSYIATYRKKLEEVVLLKKSSCTRR